MLFILLSIFPILYLCYLAWAFICMERHYKRAKSMAIPLIRMPIDPDGIVYQILEPMAWAILDSSPVPLPLPLWTRFTRRGWNFKEKAQTELRFGKIWALVTPGGTVVYLADPKAIQDVLSRRLDFPRPTKPYKLLEVFGPCISTADGDNWARHRKVLAAPFNESVMSFVWSESLQQAQDMIEHWKGRNIYSFGKDTRTLSLDVLASTGFRKPFKFQGAVEAGQKEEEHEFSYRTALQTIMDNAIPLLVLRPQLLTSKFLPKSLQRIGKAAAAFRQYMVQMLEEETTSLSQGKTGSGSLMTSLVRAGYGYSKGDDSGSTASKTKGLSVDEIFGNIFVINFAGHDTTATTLAFSILLLAIHPDIRDWLAEEVHQVCQGQDEQNWNYAELFPRLLRCRAFMYEILRLYPPIMSLLKSTTSSAQTIHLSGRTITVPSHVAVYSNILGTHCHPDHYPDPLVFKPSRWIGPAGANKAESLVTPVKGAYLSWSDGPQNCPGLKFSQVEFVAVVACLTRQCRFEIVPKAGESSAMARERAINVLNDCEYKLLLRMRDADSIRIRCLTVS